MESFADNSVRLFAAQGMVYEKFSYILLWLSMGTLVLMSASVKSCQADSAHPRVKADIALHGNPISALRDVTCHMGSHSVACQPTQVNAPRLTPAMQAGTRFAYSLLDSAPAGSRTSDLSITSPTPNRCTTKTTWRKARLRFSTRSVPCSHRLDLVS